MYLDRIRQSYEETNPKLAAQFAGISVAEIGQLESQLGVTLPAAYIEFLRWFGRSGGNIMTGSDFYYQPDLKRHGVELLNRNKLDGAAILQDAVVIMMHQGYVIHYLKTNEGPDPPVYSYMECEEPERQYEPKTLAATFSGYISQLLHTEGAPRTLLMCFSEDDLDNPYSYDDRIETLSFNAHIQARNGRMTPRIFDFCNLKELDLRYYGLKELDSRIGQLHKLTSLNLNGNKIAVLPDELYDLTELEILYLSGNELSQLSDQIARLTKLTRLNISENRLSTDTIIQLQELLPGTEIWNYRHQRPPLPHISETAQETESHSWLGAIRRLFK